MTIGAVIPVAPSAATNVVVFQCPCGTVPTSRRPRGLRPYLRAMFVLAQVSSTNFSFAGSSPGCASAQAARLAATSGRSRSAARSTFFSRMAKSV